MQKIYLNTIFRAFAMGAGIVMICSFFFPWKVIAWGSQVSYFLGIRTYAVTPFNYQFHFIIVLLTLLYFAGIFVKKIRPLKFAALIFAFAATVIAIIDVIKILPKTGTSIGLGLWLFSAASLIAFIACIGMSFEKK